MNVSNEFLTFRAKHDLSQHELASIIGVNPNMVFRYEANASKPSAKNQIRFAQKMKEWEAAHDVQM